MKKVNSRLIGFLGIYTLIIFSCNTQSSSSHEVYQPSEADSIQPTLSADSIKSALSFDEFVEENSVSSSDTDVALAHIKWAWNNHGPCTQTVLCATYIDHFGIKVTNGNFKIFIKIQRLTNSAHDCIKKAKEAVDKGEYPLAIQWVMASQIHNKPVHQWMKDHGDAVIEALRGCC